MGQKVSPRAIRLINDRQWAGRWFASRKDYPKRLIEDLTLKKLIAKTLGTNAGVAHVDIERTQKDTIVNIHTNRPGVVIGRSGQGIAKLREALEKLVGKQLKLNIYEVKQPDLVAVLVAQTIANQLVKRIMYKRASRGAMERVMNAGALGVRIEISGRLGGAEIARRERFLTGSVPLQTFRAPIDYAYVDAQTTYGTIGVKVWIHTKEKREEFHHVDAA